MSHPYPRRTPRLAPASVFEPRIVPVLARITIHSQSAWPVAADHAGRTVLIVENEDDNRTLMEEILRLAGYRCLSARNGLEALEAFDHERPDIVLTDISMPVMDGLEEVASIRARSYGASVPIVAVTAHALGGDREYALREGCTEYLAKPYRPRDLLAVVARLLKEGHE
jgi:two-component system cell cycle response regulator DivK